MFNLYTLYCIVSHSFTEVSLFSYHRHPGGRPHRPGILKLREPTLVFQAHIARNS